jgi:hypothetical protein
MRVRIALALVLLLLVAVAAVPAPFNTCYSAKGIINGPGNAKLDWAAIVVLDSLETTAKYTINCCGCQPYGTKAIFFSDGEGQILDVTPPGPVWSCPISGSWKSTDSVPLTPARVAALKAGTMSLHLSKPQCSGQVSSAYLAPGPCDQ